MLILQQLCAITLNRNITVIPIRSLHMKNKELYKKCCHILGVEENADQNTVRKAYIELVKKIHPDSGLPEASEDRFHEVDEAFKLLQQKFAKNRRGVCEDDGEDEDVLDVDHTAPQHRQYLSFDGFGEGNPFQRQKQYQQIKVMKAQQRVLKHRLDKSQAGEKTLMKKEGFFKNHAIKTKYGFDRLVEDYIQESMSKGDFNNLKGAGKPLPERQTQNPYVDFTTHKLNKILLDNGFTPEWITLQRDIRTDLQTLKNKLKEERIYFGEHPLSATQATEWQEVLKHYKTDEQRINKNIDKYNLIVPILKHQFIRLNLQKLSDEILQDTTLPKNCVRTYTKPSCAGNNTSQDNNNFLSLLSSLF